MNIQPSDVQKLRERTGVGMMECKNALTEAKGDVEKAIEILRARGIAKAAKRTDRVAREGQIVSYIHPGAKLGVLVELNSETDFVARTDDFAKLGKELAMQIAAAAPLYVQKEDVPSELVEKERSIISQQLEGEGKPAAMLEKIIPGKLEKFYSEICLVEQPCIKDASLKVKDMITQTIAKLGEKIVVKRFARYKLGEN